MLFAARPCWNEYNHTILTYMVVFLFMAVKEAEPWEKIGGSFKSIDGLMMRQFNLEVDQTEYKSA